MSIPFPAYLATETINVLRRANSFTASRDSLNNPVYGDPTDWIPVYTNIKVRLSYDGKSLRYAPTGELIQPQADMMYDSSQYTMMAQDHIVIVSSPGWPVGTEYVCSAVYSSFYDQGITAFGMCKILLPII